MVSLLVRDGNFDVGLARAAIEEASNGAISLAPPAALEMPDIDTSKNVIKTADREVEVLLTLQSPRIVLLGNVLSEEECDQLAAYCEPKLQRSPVVNDAAHKAGEYAAKAGEAVAGQVDGVTAKIKTLTSGKGSDKIDKFGASLKKALHRDHDAEGGDSAEQQQPPTA